MPELKTLLLELAVICAVGRLLGWVFEKLGQPRVVGEILAGILLGPSLLGWLAPSTFKALFPSNGLGPLYFLSQIGLLLFMFQVGAAIDLREVRKLGGAVVLTSNVSVMVPLAAGGCLALYLYPRLSNASVSLSVFALFMGTAMSITAFPVLARILTERNLLQTRVGMVAISSAAVDDITAWCLLAFLIAKVRAGTASVWWTLVGVAAYLIVMTWAMRPLIMRYSEWRRENWREALAFSLIFLFLSAWTTERIGIHALFGAFFAGVILPRTGNLSFGVTGCLEKITRVLLLPLFFAFTGLRTSVRLLNTGTLWFYCGVVILVAVVGKMLGCALSARASGMSWRDALSVGALMNTRGLIELVILNVGLDLGVISPTLFSMMVIMALVTTFMTTPLLTLLALRRDVTPQTGEQKAPMHNAESPGR